MSNAPEQNVNENQTSGFETTSSQSLSITNTKADLGKRFVAIVLDMVIAAVLALIPVVGGLIACAYLVVRDGLEFDFMDRRSIGKKVMKLRPVRLDGKPMDIQTSLTRNWMYGMGFIAAIPVIGWILALPIVLLAFGILIYDLIKIFGDPQARRLGDTMAKTVVIEVNS